MNAPVTAPGRLIAVVGPSGVGKDSVMAGIIAAKPQVQLVRRTITRAPELGGEDYDAITPEAFAEAAARHAFCVHWGAHGLFYGLPAALRDEVATGAECLANLSRGALLDAAQIFPRMVVLHITASPDVLAQRLKARGRETPQDIEKRLALAAKPLPSGLNVVEIRNDAALGDAITAATAALWPAATGLKNE